MIFIDIDIASFDYLIFQKFNFICYVCAAFLLSVILAVLSIGIRLMFSYSTIYPGSGLSTGDTNKRTPYECGFEPFNDARNTFDVKFYLVGILFLIFDLEVAFLFPWVLALPKLSFFGFWSMMFFLFILIVGFVYEWKIGGLEWN